MAMDDKKRKVLVDWLNDAHAMETSLAQMLEEQTRKLEKKDLDTYEVLSRHLAQTIEHADRIEECLKRLKARVSAAKTAVAFMGGTMKGLGADAADDAMVRDIINGYMNENLEIAVYKTVIAAAKEVDDMQTVVACEAILVEEEKMAAWFGAHLEPAVKGYLEGLGV